MARKTQTAKGRGAGSDAVRIGIIGGSGLYNMPGLEKPREVRVKTPFGNPSDALVVGTMEGKRVAFLARHARGHRLTHSVESSGSWGTAGLSASTSPVGQPGPEGCFSHPRIGRMMFSAAIGVPL